MTWPDAQSADAHMRLPVALEQPCRAQKRPDQFFGTSIARLAPESSSKPVRLRAVTPESVNIPGHTVNAHSFFIVKMVECTSEFKKKKDTNQYPFLLFLLIWMFQRKNAINW